MRALSAKVRDGIGAGKQIIQEGRIRIIHVLGNLGEQALEIFIDFQMICLCNLDNAANREFLTIFENSWDFLRMPGTSSCIPGTLSHTLSAFGIRIIYCLPTIEKNLAKRLPQRYDLRQPLVKSPELEF